MATRAIHQLSGTQITGKKKPGRYADGGGLYLQIGPTGGRAWLFRFMLNGKSREMGLGPIHTIDVAKARAEAAECRRLVLAGVDPIEAREAGRTQALIEASRSRTFKDCATAYIDSHKTVWKNDKHAAQWVSTLDTYVYPIFGDLPASAVDTGKVMEVLEADKLWTTKTETATRIRGRIEKVLDWAAARGYRDNTNPARWTGHLDKLLPKPSKLRKVKHHAALPYSDLPAFFEKLIADTSGAARALQIIILTATRTNEALQANWSEFDLDSKVWTIPSSRMKAGVEHRVPLSDAAVEVIKTQLSTKQNDFVFPGAKAKKPLSNMACLMLLGRMQRDDITVHGFRSTFRDWAAETTNFSREVAEMALAHTIKDDTEAAYRRGDLLDKRRTLMTLWADYCGGKFGAKITPIGKRKAA
jgi:integrase